MAHDNSLVLQTLRVLGVAAALFLSNAHADEYSDVTQLVQSGKLADALGKADQYLAAKPRDPQMRFLKGVIQRDSGKTNDAIATFTRLTEDFPELPEPYNNLAVLYAGQSQFDKARTALEMAIRTNPSYATAHENLGDVYAKLASQAYNKALQLDANNTGVPPKLALIRELFNPAMGKGTRPGAATVSTTAAPAKTAPAAAEPAATSGVATAPTVKPTAAATPEKNTSANNEVEAAVQAWANAWSSKDMKAYLADYAKDFRTPGGMGRNAWENERRKRIVGKNTISVKLASLNTSTRGNKATVKFRQEYKAGSLVVSSRKTLELEKDGDRWLIVKESVGS